MTNPAVAEPFVGQAVEPRSFTITPELVRSYYAGLDLDTRCDAPLMLANHVDTGNRVLFSQQRGHLWLRQEWEFSGSLAMNVEYTVEGSVVDIYPRRDRTILLTETVLRDPDGTVLSRQRHHQSFLLDRPGDAEVRLRDPGEKEGARTAPPAALREIASLEKTVTLEMCGEFFHGSRSYHSDAEQSRALGFRDVVVGGRMTMGYVGELLESEIGERWAESGKLLVKFTNVLWPGEPIHVSASLGEPLTEDSGREGVAARVEKADGTVVLVAEGSVRR